MKEKTDMKFPFVLFDVTLQEKTLPMIKIFLEKKSSLKLP